MLDSKPEPPGENTELRRALAAADPATLLLSLVQLTGERHCGWRRQSRSSAAR